MLKLLESDAILLSTENTFYLKRNTFYLWSEGVLLKLLESDATLLSTEQITHSI